MDCCAYLGYGVQIQEYDEPIKYDLEAIDDETWNSNTLELIYGAYEGEEKFVVAKNTYIAAIDWSATKFDKLPSVDGDSLVALIEFCDKYDIPKDFGWFLIPHAG